MGLEVYPTRSAWLAARRNSIGASEAAAVLGCSEWDKADDVLAAKVNGGSKPENDAMRAGRIFEPAIIQYWAEGYGAQLITPVVGFTLYRHPRLPFVHASPDHFALVDAKRVVVQAKRSHPRHLKKWQSQGARIEYEVQVQHEMFVLSEIEGCAVERGYLIADFGGDDVLSFEVKPDPALWASMERVYSEFWPRVEEMRRICQ